MRRFFYQANFCAECGNALPVRRAWRPRYFCEACAQQQRQHSVLYRMLIPSGILLGTLSWALASHDGPPLETFSSTGSPPAATVTALDATARPHSSSPPPAPSPEAPSAFCGARTRRGTPCRRLVQPGQRCAQHRNQPMPLKGSGL